MEGLSQVTGNALSMLALSALSLGAGGVLPASAASHTVQIVAMGTGGCANQFCYQPATQAATSGDNITWQNSTTTSHTVTRCDPTNCAGQGPGTGGDNFGSTSLIGTAGSYQFTFQGSGTYLYYCQVHGYGVMHGEVDITPAATVAETPYVPLLALPAILVVGGLAVRRRLQRRQAS
jgi:plastocyanin